MNQRNDLAEDLLIHNLGFLGSVEYDIMQKKSTDNMAAWYLNNGKTSSTGTVVGTAHLPQVNPGGRPETQGKHKPLFMTV